MRDRGMCNDPNQNPALGSVLAAPLRLKASRYVRIAEKFCSESGFPPMAFCRLRCCTSGSPETRARTTAFARLRHKRRNQSQSLVHMGRIIRLESSVLMRKSFGVFLVQETERALQLDGMLVLG